MRWSNSFILSLCGLVALFVLALSKGIDTSTAILGIVASYVGARSAQKASAVYSASKDPDADTIKMAAIVDGISHEKG